MTNTDIEYLLTLQAVRERANKVYAAAEKSSLKHFDYHAERMPAVVSYVSGVIERDFGPDKFNTIPPHGRWQHFEVGGRDRLSPLLAKTSDAAQQTRMLIDLFWVSVLLDAGAGDTWKFSEPGTHESYNRSEGIAVASLYMFQAGAFSSDSTKPLSVDGQALCALTKEALIAGFQVSATNSIIGIESRLALLQDVGKSLLSLEKQGFPSGRPSDLVDTLLSSSTDGLSLDYAVLWKHLQQVLIPSWPKTRPHVRGQPIGDAWPLSVLGEGTSSTDTSIIQPFHKLTQWLGYSLTVPFVRLLGKTWINMGLGTGLPEYRNGGLFVDLQVLTLKPATLKQGQEASKQDLPLLDATSDAIVEWRAMTVALLDRLYVDIAKHFSSKGVSLSMAQMLEAGSWKAGRELAAQHRPATKSSPILLAGDGTIF